MQLEQDKKHAFNDDEQTITQDFSISTQIANGWLPERINEQKGIPNTHKTHILIHNELFGQTSGDEFTDYYSALLNGQAKRKENNYSNKDFYCALYDDFASSFEYSITFKSLGHIRKALKRNNFLSKIYYLDVKTKTIYWIDEDGSFLHEFREFYEDLKYRSSIKVQSGSIKKAHFYRFL